MVRLSLRRRSAVARLLLAALAGACCPTPATPAPDGGAPGATPEVADPCAAYVEAICVSEAGDEETCRTIGTAVTIMGANACRAALHDVDAALQTLHQLRGACDELQVRLCADIGEDTESCRLVREQTPNFSADRCVAMLEQYADVLADLRALEAQNEPLPPDVWARVSAPGGPSFGPADARVVLAVFSDFHCPYCKFAAETLAVVRERFAGRSLRVVMREFPLPMHGEIARVEAEAALEAQAQGRYWELYDLLFAEQESMSRREDVDGAAERAGLAMDAYRQAMDEHRWEAALNDDVALGEAAFINGTPTFVLDGQRLSIDARSPDDLAGPLDAALIAAGDPAPAAPQTPSPAP
jgi:protein-disulfide isomerase